jgi:hypothetical protein
MTRPGRLRNIANGVGRPLPESIRDRIRNGLASSAATPGHLMRSMLAFLVVYAAVALLLLPGSPAIRAAALVLAVVLALVDSFACIAMNTQRRPAQRYRPEDLEMHAAPVDTNMSGNSTNTAETMESGPARERQSRVVMASAGHVELTEQELDAIAWQFLGSEFTGELYANWPIDRRVNAYLVHHRLMHVANDGAACDALLHRVMANIGRALRHGVLTRGRPSAV